MLIRATKSKELERVVKGAFRNNDLDRTGTLDQEQSIQLIRDIASSLGLPPLSPPQMDQILLMADEDGNGCIDKQELMSKFSEIVDWLLENVTHGTKDGPASHNNPAFISGLGKQIKLLEKFKKRGPNTPDEFVAPSQGFSSNSSRFVKVNDDLSKQTRPPRKKFVPIKSLINGPSVDSNLSRLQQQEISPTSRKISNGSAGNDFLDFQGKEDSKNGDKLSGSNRDQKNNRGLDCKMRRKSMISKNPKIWDLSGKGTLEHQKSFDNKNQRKSPKSPMTIGDNQIIEMRDESLSRTGSPRNPENHIHISEQSIYDLVVSDLGDSPKRNLCKICPDSGLPEIDTGPSLGLEDKYIFYNKNQTRLEGKLVKYLEAADEGQGQFCEAGGMDECEKIWKADEQYKEDFRSFRESLKNYFDAP